MKNLNLNLGRLDLGCIEEFLDFFFDFVENLILCCSFLSKNIKICKKEDKIFSMKILIFSDFATLRGIFLTIFF